MSPLTPLYLLIGGLLASAAWHAARDSSLARRWPSAIFWGLLAFTFIAGDQVPPAAIGALVIVLALIAGFGGVGRGLAPDTGASRVEGAARLGHRLFVPALLIPAL